ncbi:MAG: hypothetical protein AAF692_11155 [Pseudomonadota bacterium]
MPTTELSSIDQAEFDAQLALITEFWRDALTRRAASSELRPARSNYRALDAHQLGRQGALDAFPACRKLHSVLALIKDVTTWMEHDMPCSELVDALDELAIGIQDFEGCLESATAALEAAADDADTTERDEYSMLQYYQAGC